jgi:hypothetical protein
MEDLTGKQLGQYQIVAPLGEGGMAAVYKAYHPAMERYVALKILPRHFASDPQFLGRFHQEIKVIAKLQHPHILQVYDFGEVDGYTFLVMPFVETGTLADLMRGKPLPLQQIRDIVAQVSDALDYAHTCGLVHRDVKPSNVLMDERGNCLLTDFGIAKIVEGAAHFTRTGSIIGTPTYMSPEQGLGQKLDGRSDVYSLGVVLYELATGRPPFDAETPMAIVIKHIHDPLPPPRTVNPALPEAVEQVILKALAKQPEDRYATCGDMSRALQTVGTGPAAAALPKRQPTKRMAGVQPPSPPLKRMPVWAWMLSGMVVLCLLVGLLAGGGSMLATMIRPSATAPAASMAGSVTAVPLGTTAVLTTVGPPTPASMATAPRSPTDAPLPVLTVDRSSQFTAVPDAVVGQFFAPCPNPAGVAVVGDTLWIADEDQRRLYQLDRAGTPLASFPITPTGEIQGLAWDGEALCLALRRYPGDQVARLNTSGTVIESFLLPVAPIGLGWDPVEGTLWMASEEFLLKFSADGRMLQSFHAPIHGGAQALTAAPDGLWAASIFGNWYRFSLAGEKLFEGSLPTAGPFFHGALAWDERGYLWVVTKDDRQVYQISSRQAEVGPPPTPRGGAELALPRPQLEPTSATDRAIVQVTNDLPGTLSLSFGDESVILAPGQTWSAELDPGVYEVFASTSVPKPIAFSSQELLVSGYEHAWFLAP